MVDFNNEATVGTPAIDVERISILQRRYDVIEALEDYKKKRYQGSGMTLSIVRARLLSLFLEIQAYLKRKLSPEDYKTLIGICLEGDTEAEMLTALCTINEHLDAMRLIRIDTQHVYDYTSPMQENKAKDY